MKISAKVHSSAISKIEYDDESKELSVTFTSGGTYDYPGVPESEVMNLIKADSVGRYFHSHIRRYSAK